MAKKILITLLTVWICISFTNCGGGGSATPPPNGNGNGNPLPSVSSISPSSGTVGGAAFTLTVTGTNFVSGSVVKWAGVSLTTTFASATSLTASVPASNLASQGTTAVTVSTPAPGGGTSSTLVFAVEPQNGSIFTNDPGTMMANATSNVPGEAVDSSLISHGVILDQIDVLFAANATVARVNAALASVQGGILSMSKGTTFVTVAVPAQPTTAAIALLAQTLRASAGVVIAFPARVATTQVLPSAPASFSDLQLLPTRFPAAWNVQRLATNNCESRKVPILIPDDFLRPAPITHDGFSLEVPSTNFTLLSAGENGTEAHGYDVTTTLAAMFNSTSPTGANPFVQCLDITAVQTANLDTRALMDRVALDFPSASAPFIMNYSAGFNDVCDLDPNANPPRCTADSITHDIAGAAERAVYGLYWKQLTHSEWGNFLATTSAGNSADDLIAQFYSGPGESRYNSFLNIATNPDPLFAFVSDTTKWQSSAQPPLPDLTASPADVSSLNAYIVAQGLDKVAGEDNVLISGSTTSGATFNDLLSSTFSDSGEDINAVGQGVNTFSGLVDGTSFSAPQVAGLASYLWLLSDDLRQNQPVQTTRQAILLNGRAGAAGNVIDAYATVLSLDAAALPNTTNAPIRLALLDVNNDSKFDENDLTIFLSHLQDGFGNAVEPTTRDYSRFDLNGDGFTGGGRTEKFDLDRVGSVQYGITNHSSDVTQEIEQKTIHFDETAVNDLEILCYYAYSSLYTGDVAERAHLMGGCAGVTVKVNPGSANVEIAGGRQAFNASVIGSNDPRVTWTATGGTLIFDNGIPIFVAGNTPGVFAIRATSVADPRAFGEATITVGTCAGKLARFQGSSGLEVLVGVGANSNPDKSSNTASTLTDSASNSNASANATATYGSLQASVHSDDVANDGAAVLMQSSDLFVIVPDDPALVGAQATLTQTFHLTSTGSVSGANAQALIVINGIENNVLSTQSPHNEGNVNADRDITVSGSTQLGEVGGISNLLIMNAELTCAVNNSDSCDTTGSGTANAQATLAFQSMKVTDQSGNQIGFSVCSVTGFTYGN